MCGAGGGGNSLGAGIERGISVSSIGSQGGGMAHGSQIKAIDLAFFDLE